MAEMTDPRTYVRFYQYSDVDRILRRLYQGQRDRVQAIGWPVRPCPDGLQAEVYRGPARDRYLALVEQLTKASG